MKIKKSELIAALQGVNPAISQKEGGIEQSTCYVFQDNNVYAYNDELFVSHPCKVGFEGAIPAKEFLALVSKVNAEEIDITANAGELLVKGSRAKAGLRLEAKINLPISEMELPEGDDWDMLPDNFCDAVKFCLFTVSKDNNKPILTCVHVFGTYIESSDNFRITRYNMKTTKKNIIKTDLLIPFNAAKNLVNHSPVEYAVTEGWLHFKNKEDVIFSCRIFDEEFPNFDEFLDVEGDEITLPDALNEVLDRASVMSNGERVTLVLEDDVLLVETKGDKGWFEEKVKIKYEGEPVEFSIHPEFLKKILKAEGDIIIGENMLLFEGENYRHVCKLLQKKD